MKSISQTTFRFLGALALMTAALPLARAQEVSTRVYEISRTPYTLKMFQVYPAKSAQDETQVDVEVVNYKAVARDEHGNLSDPIYFTKMFGYGIDVTAKDPQNSEKPILVANTFKMLVSKMSSESPSGMPALRAAMLDPATNAPRGDGTQVILELGRTEGFGPKYNVVISVEENGQKRQFFAGELVRR
ncbi:MAG TPA: hypothetical protein VM901_07135 [Bdellovibrionota bacterium]|jgi:hypothetical protein|nr:hypothetical protein [Bdellovibrionota bacterium]